MKNKFDITSKKLNFDDEREIEMIDIEDEKEEMKKKKKKCPSFCGKGNDVKLSSSNLDSQSKILIRMTIIGVVLGLILGKLKKIGMKNTKQIQFLI